MKRPFPRFESDADAERFVDEADLSEYDFSQFRPMRFELRPKGRTVSLRLSQDLLEAAKGTAAAQGIPCHRYIRDAIERALTGDRKRGPA